MGSSYNIAIIILCAGFPLMYLMGKMKKKKKSEFHCIAVTRSKHEALS